MFWYQTACKSDIVLPLRRWDLCTFNYETPTASTVHELTTCHTLQTSTDTYTHSHRKLVVHTVDINDGFSNVIVLEMFAYIPRYIRSFTYVMSEITRKISGYAKHPQTSTFLQEMNAWLKTLYLHSIFINYCSLNNMALTSEKTFSTRKKKPTFTLSFYRFKIENSPAGFDLNLQC